MTENTPRMCPDTLGPRVDRTAWQPPAVFDWLQDVGKTTEDEMHRTFNMGIGMILAVSPDKVDTVLAELQAIGELAVILGDLVDA